MINTVYRLKSPRRFEIAFEDFELENETVVRPTHLSICNADQRYYQGTRDAKVLKEKLPMALIHEAVGEVVFDKSGKFNIGDKVVMIPNQPVESDEYIAENYLRTSKFCGSSCDGFLQEYYVLPAERLLKLPDDINLDVAAFTEIVSVSMHAVTRFDSIAHNRRDVIGVWGDGNLAFITALLIKKSFPNTKVLVFGINSDKLSDFSFADETYLTTEIPENIYVDHAFECVGSNGSPIAIEQIISLIKPEGTISIMGVSEYPVPVNTRMILEKGLRLFGTSRSGREDFEKTIEMYQKHPQIVRYLQRLVSNVVEIEEFSDIKKAFEVDLKKPFGKTIMHWNI